MEIVNDKAVISFVNTDGLVIKNKNVAGLYIAGEDHQFYPAEALIKDGKLVVWSKKVIKPVGVRYAFSNTAQGNIFSNLGMPVAPFRTDDWDMDTGPENLSK